MLRSLLQSEDDTLAARTTVPRAAATLAKAHRSIRSPSLTTTSVAVPACRWSVIPLMYSGMRRSRYTWMAMRTTHAATMSLSRPLRYLSIMIQTII